MLRLGGPPARPAWPPFGAFLRSFPVSQRFPPLMNDREFDRAQAETEERLRRERAEEKRRRIRAKRCENCGSHTPSGSALCKDCKLSTYPQNLQPNP